MKREEQIYSFNQHIFSVHLPSIGVIPDAKDIPENNTEPCPHGGYILVMGDRQKYKKVSIVPEMIQAIEKRQ